MFDKLFGWGKKKDEKNPLINFGRYSDNNKSLEKSNRWGDADNLFKEKKYQESFDAFFDYLKDDVSDNVIVNKKDGQLFFEIFQGSKILRGVANQRMLKAEVSLAKMPTPSVAVMRRLLEQNFTLYYSRYALDNGRLCMRFDSDIETANPHKLYYAFKELSTKADKQDDLLVHDFNHLESLDTEHVQEIPVAEKEIKYTFLQKWIKDTLAYITTLDEEKMCGGIAYMLLSLAFKIDYLVCPEGTLQNELEKIAGIYFAQDERSTVEKNKDMIAAYNKFLLISAEEVYKNLFRSKSCFSIRVPTTQQVIAEAISSANKNMIWYKDNNYPTVAIPISEYGIAFCQYSYSLPRPLTEFFHLLMRINHADYFTALGFSDSLFNMEKNKLNGEAIIKNIFSIQNNWKQRYPKLDIKINKLQFDNKVNFTYSFTNELENLNFDNK